MRKIVLAINTSPDGFCDHRSVVADEELHKFYSDLLLEADTILYGRKTFQLMDPYWPSVARNKSGTPSEIEFAERLNDLHKIVYSRKGIFTDWKNTTVLPKLDPEEILALKQMPGKNILAGGPSIVDQLTQWALIDEYIYVLQPLIAGKGKRFFENENLKSSINLQLQRTTIFESGAVALFYKNKE